MLVDKIQIRLCSFNDLDSLCCVFNGETGLLVSSGFVWYVSNDNWYVATTASNYQRIARIYEVEFADGREFAATVAFSDIDTNIAFVRVKVDGSATKAARIGRSGNLKVGQMF